MHHVTVEPHVVTTLQQELHAALEVQPRAVLECEQD